MRWRRWLGFLFVLALIVVLIAWGFSPQPVLVEAAEVVRGPLQVTIEEEGRTRVVDRFVVSAPVSGFVRRLEHKVGDPVRKGQRILRLEPLQPQVLDSRSRAESEARVSAAQARLNSAREQAASVRAEVEFRKKELERVLQLFERGALSRQQRDRAETDLERAQAGLQSAEFEVEVAQFELESARAALLQSSARPAAGASETVSIYAPENGRILRIFQESEGVVAAGQSLVEVGDPRALEMEIEVLSEDAVGIGPRTRVLFRRWGGAGPLEGRVRTVEPVAFTKISALGVEEQRVLVIADFVSPPQEWERLGHAYRVEARFVLWEGDDVLQVPASALFRQGQDWAVFVIENQTARLRRVETGHDGGMQVQIVSGLEEGERVILHPDDSVQDGTGVEML